MKRFLILILMLLWGQAEEIQKIYEQPRLFLEVETEDSTFIVLYRGEKTGEKVRTVATVPDCIWEDGTCRVKITLPRDVRQVYNVKVKVRDANGELMRKYDLPAVKTAKPPVSSIQGPGNGTIIELGGLFRVSYAIAPPYIALSNYGRPFIQVITPSGKVYEDYFFCTGYNCYFDYTSMEVGTYTWQLMIRGVFGIRKHEKRTFFVPEHAQESE
jgi:hypothetical protein